VVWLCGKSGWWDWDDILKGMGEDLECNAGVNGGVEGRDDRMFEEYVGEET
jgi:hypothetical protein